MQPALCTKKTASDHEAAAKHHHKAAQFHDQNKVGDGKIKVHEDFVDGLENAPLAFIGLLEGKNFGKLIVRVAQD